MAVVRVRSDSFSKAVFTEHVYMRAEVRASFILPFSFMHLH